MKIESGRGVGPSTGAKRAGGTAAPGFAPSGPDAPQKTAAATGVSGVTALDAILALQVKEQPGACTKTLEKYLWKLIFLKYIADDNV